MTRKPTIPKRCACGGTLHPIELRGKLECDGRRKQVFESALSLRHDGRRALAAENRYYNDPNEPL